MRYTVIAYLFLIAVVVQGKTIEVGSGKLKTIREALQIADHGDTILVQPGIYKEGNIVVKKSVALIGVDYPTVDGELKYEVFTVNADKVSIQYFRIRNVGISSMNDLAAIGGNNSKGLLLANNIIDNAFFGIHLANCKNSRVENNVLTSEGKDELHTGNGIHLWKSDRITVKNNTVTGHRDGIYFEFVTNSLIKDNISENNLRYGLHFMFSHEDEYSGNTFKNNGAGIAVMYSKKVTMTGNRFEANWGASAYGLLLKEISDSNISNNIFFKNTVAIYMEGCSRSRFQSNEFRENGWGIKLQASCDDNDFKTNNFIANSFDLGTNGTMTLNSITNNYWDKYTGYDLDKDGVGDVPFHPASLYAMMVEKMPTSVMLWRSFLVFLLDKAEKVIPVVTPENLKDDNPAMQAYDIGN